MNIRFQRDVRFFCALVVAISFLISMGVQAQARELLINPGFEALEKGLPASWHALGGGGAERYPYESGGVKVTGDVVRSGESAIEMELDTGNFYITQVVSVDAGKVYELSAWVKSSLSPGGKTAFKAEFRDKERRYIPTAQGGAVSSEWTESYEDWKQVSMQVEAPQEAADVVLLLRLYGPGKAYYDDVSFKEIRSLGSVGSCGDTVCNPEAVQQVLEGELSEANVAWWGFDAEDSTEFIQAAIDSGASRVIIPNVGQDWIVRPISLRSDLELFFEEGVVVTAKKGEFLNPRISVFTGRDVENVVLSGYGATIRMHKADYTQPPYERGEWRHAIEIRGGKNVEIAGLTVRDTGGDGIYIGRGTMRPHNEDIVIRDVIADNNHRQGMSVITVKGLLVEGSVFKNTEGTLPMAGIDFEPNRADELLEDIVVRDSVFDSNRTAGIIIHPTNFNQDSAPVSMVFENVLFRGNGTGIIYNIFGRENQQPSGEIVLRNCIIEGFRTNGIHIRGKFVNPEVTPMKVLIEDCVVNNVRTDPTFPPSTNANAILLSAESWLEDVTFRNVVVAEDMNSPVMRGRVTRSDVNPPELHGLHGIHGEIYAVNPHGAYFLWGGPNSDVTLEAKEKESVTLSYSDIVSHPDYQFDPVEVRVEAIPDPIRLCAYLGPNLLTNPGFEEHTDSIPEAWVARGGGGAERYPFEIGGIMVHPDAARSGDAGVKMEMDTGGNYYLTQRVPVEEGSVYEFLAWVRSEFVPGGKVELKAEFYGEDGHVGEERKEWFESHSEWKKITAYFTAPDRATSAVMFLRLYGPGWAHYDNASMRAVDCIPGPTHRMVIS